MINTRRVFLSRVALGSFAVPFFLQEIKANADTPALTKALYGFSSRKAPFDSMPHSKIPGWLTDHGINSIFFSPSEEKSILKDLQEHKITCYQEFAVFTSRTDYQNHPSWRPIKANGEQLEPDGWYHGLCPNNPDLRQNRLQRFRKRLQNPYLQGIWLDFIRYPIRWEKPKPNLENTCFCEHCLKKFSQQHNIDLPQKETEEIASFILNNHLQTWNKFRINTITSWVKEAKKILQEEREDILLGLFLVPWQTTDFNNAIINIVGQDVNQLKAYVDIFSPMVYHRMLERPPQWVGDVTQKVREQTQKLVWPIVQAMNEQSELPPTEFRQTLHTAMQSSQSGVIIFSLRHVENHKRWDSIQNVFQSDQAE